MATKRVKIPFEIEIPAHWKAVTNRGIFKEYNVRGMDQLQLLSVSQRDGVVLQTEITTKKDTSNDNKANYKHVKDGDIVYNKMRMWQGAVGVSKYEGIVSPAYVILRGIRNDVDPEYFHYQYRTKFYIKQSGIYSYGLCDDMNSLRYEDFKNMKSILPPIDDQKDIVKRIKHYNEAINEFISKKQKYIELLKEYKQSKINELVTKGLDPNVKMKDSGIEWLGQIPEHWEVRRIKDLFSINTESLSETTDPEYKLLYLDIGNNGQGKIKHLQSLLFKNAPSRARRVVHSGSIILSTVRTYLRSISFFESPPQNLIASTGYAVLDIRNNDYRGGYFYSLLQSSYFIDKVVAESVGVSYPAINTTKLSSIKIAFTSKLEEQLLITKEVAHINQQIGMLISKAQNQIKIIRKYRQSLIYELVTGIRKP